MVSGVLAGDLVDENAYASKDPSRISLPILRAPGKPDYFVMADGSYAARYSYEGGRYLTIIGTPRPAREHSYPPVGMVSIMGRTTGYNVTGNEDPEITSKAVRLHAADGRSANYVIIHGGTTGNVTGSSLANSLPRLSW